MWRAKRVSYPVSAWTVVFWVCGKPHLNFLLMGERLNTQLHFAKKRKPGGWCTNSKAAVLVKH